MNRVVTERVGIQTGHHVFHLYKKKITGVMIGGLIFWRLTFGSSHWVSVGPYIFLCEANEE